MTSRFYSDEADAVPVAPIIAAARWLVVGAIFLLAGINNGVLALF